MLHLWSSIVVVLLPFSLDTIRAEGPDNVVKCVQDTGYGIMNEL